MGFLQIQFTTEEEQEVEEEEEGTPITHVAEVGKSSCWNQYPPQRASN